MSEIQLSEVKHSVVELGTIFGNLVKVGDETFDELLLKVRPKNPWFTEENVHLAFSSWADVLTKESLNEWLKPYDQQLNQSRSAKTIGVINAGNIPLVGLHDLLSVILSGNNYLGKNASDDPFLLPFVAEKLLEIEPKFKSRISFSEKLSGFDAVIATGSNNSARYFDYYFGKYPHIIRMNRNAVAVFTGDETEADFKKIGHDIFQYFGLGCRNVSKIFVPRGYEFPKFFEAIESFSLVSRHNKYMNNHDYNKTIYLLKKIPFFDNDFLILKEDEGIASPISVVYYEFYDDIKSLEKKLETEKDQIQCIVSGNQIFSKFKTERFGEAQCPQLWDYADRVDTLNFLFFI